MSDKRDLMNVMPDIEMMRLKQEAAKVPPEAMEILQSVMFYGAVRGKGDSWRGIPIDTHLSHALRHITAYYAGDTGERHLRHAYCRLMMAAVIQSRIERGAGREFAAVDGTVYPNETEEEIARSQRCGQWWMALTLGAAFVVGAAIAVWWVLREIVEWLVG